MPAADEEDSEDEWVLVAAVAVVAVVLALDRLRSAELIGDWPADWLAVLLTIKTPV